MRSSRAGRSGPGLLLIAAALASSCSNAPASGPATGETGTIDCSTSGVDASAATTVQEVRRAAESGPAYRALASSAPLRSCRVVSDSGGISVEYAFVNGAVLTFARNPAIEYTSQQVAFGSVSSDNVLELLRRVERASFSPAGCGIDWTKATPLASGDGGSETGYYGETCNCQARVQTDASGKVLGFVFRSTC